MCVVAGALLITVTLGGLATPHMSHVICPSHKSCVHGVCSPAGDLLEACAATGAASGSCSARNHRRSTQSLLPGTACPLNSSALMGVSVSGRIQLIFYKERDRACAGWG